MGKGNWTTACKGFERAANAPLDVLGQRVRATDGRRRGIIKWGDLSKLDDMLLWVPRPAEHRDVQLVVRAASVFKTHAQPAAGVAATLCSPLHDPSPHAPLTTSKQALKQAGCEYVQGQMRRGRPGNGLRCCTTHHTALAECSRARYNKCGAGSPPSGLPLDARRKSEGPGLASWDAHRHCSVLVAVLAVPASPPRVLSRYLVPSSFAE